MYYEETLGSTMDASRLFARGGEVHGTVIAAGFQEKGRGRSSNRSWDMERGQSLPFTVLLRYSPAALPSALTLRSGLALALAIEDFAPALNGKVHIKWPNDLLLPAKGSKAMRKVAGILAEAEGGTVHIGMGVNIGQQMFPPPLDDKATSISLALGKAIESGERFTLLALVLKRLHDELDAPFGSITAHWKERLEKRLYKKGELVSFARGAADSKDIVSGWLSGVGDGGELLLMSEGGGGLCPYYSGELVGLYGAS